MRIDAHQHFWDLQRFPYPWMSMDQTVLRRNYFPDDLEPILELNRFDGSIAVQATMHEKEVWWLLDLARRHESILGVVGWVDLTAPDLQTKLKRLAQERRFKGVRHPVHDEADERWLVRPDVIRGLQEVARHGLPYDLLLRPQHLPLVPELAAQVPDLVLVLDHIGKPDTTNHQWDDWATSIEQLAVLPQLNVKLSGLISEAGRDWTAEQLRPYVQHVLSCFGPERCMFGSDWPVCLQAGTWKESLAAFTQAIGAQSMETREHLLGATARRVYRLD